MKKLNGFLLIMVIMFVPLAGFAIVDILKPTEIKEQNIPIGQQSSKTTARIMANGDLLYHDLLYMSALKADGTYDFKPNYEYAKEWLEKADLALGDYEGTIRPNYTLGGYPLFNAPQEVATAIQWAGYDVVDLAHNHILDSKLEGVKTTVEAFEKEGITPIGVFTKEKRKDAPIVIKEVNGIKIALLAYSYGFNGMEKTISDEDYQNHLADLNKEAIQKDLERAEKEADITIVMPQMGVEYMLQPTQEQKELYHQMIDWGADIILGGHPHVVQPAEIVDKSGERKLIIYSMGNFISNQRYETLENYWTERGVLMDIMIEKKNNSVRITKAKAYPTWVSRRSNGKYSPEGYPLYHYQTYILEDFIDGGKYRDKLDDSTKKRIDTAYKEMNEHVQLQWDES